MVEFLFNKVAALKASNFIKKKLRHKCFLMNIVKLCYFVSAMYQVIILCNLGRSRPKQNCVGFFLSKLLLRAQGQYCTSNFLVQCCLRRTWTTLSIRFSYAEAVVRRCSEKGALKNFTKFTEKHLCQSLFLNKVAGLRAVTLLKKRLNSGIFLWTLRNF